MPTTSRCLSLHDLRRYALGQITEADAEQLEHHLQGCDQCAAGLSGLHAHDTLIDALRMDTPLLSDVERSEVTELMDRLKAQPPRLESSPTVGEVVEEEVVLGPPQQSDEIGRLGPYRVLRKLGAGGMGVVFLAEEWPLTRLVALKVMKPALSASEQARQRFLREARAAAAIEHEHIIPLYHFGEEGGVLFLAFKFLKGESLEDRLRNAGKLPLTEVLRIGREISEGLEAAHAHGLIHRDIKPSNIWLEDRGDKRLACQPTSEPLVAANGRVKILDFGTVRSDGDGIDLTQTGHVLGTPAYMSPEQARGERGDPRSDLFSLGVVLYQICTGKQPFRGDNPLAILDAIRNQHPRAPRDLDPAVPSALSELVMKLLEKDPDRRPPTAHAVVEAIRAIETSPSEQTASLHLPSPSGISPIAPRWPRGAPWIVAGTLVLGIGLGVLLTTLLGRGPGELAEQKPPAGTKKSDGDADAGLPGFRSTGTMQYDHGTEFSLTRLKDGRVLAVGDQNTNDPRANSAEIYDPVTKTWSVTGSLNTGRTAHRATLLADGRVLVSGGLTVGATLDSCEIFDPATGRWKLTGRMASPRSVHVSLLLESGKVLVATGGTWGREDTVGLATAELWDPETEKWTPTGSLNTGRMTAAGTLLADGRVLIAGGMDRGVTFANFTSAEVYDPITEKWQPAGNMAIGRRANFTLTTLTSGKVLVAGGGIDWTSQATEKAELYDPKLGAWLATGPLPAPRHGHTTTLLGDGTVLVAGGSDAGAGRPERYLDTAYIYDPVKETWSSTPNTLGHARTGHQAVRLLNGTVLVVGGSDGPATLKTGELYRPTTPSESRE